MAAPAATRLHVVVLSAEEISPQEDRGRDAITLAADPAVESPGRGRVAIVVSRDDGDSGAAITHLGVVKASGKSTTLDVNWAVSSLQAVTPPIALSDIEADLGSAAEVVRRVAASRRGGGLSDPVSDRLRRALMPRVGPENWPQVGTPSWMRPRLDGDIREQYTNAVGTALMFSGMDAAPLRTLPLPGESPLTSLRLQPSEASLIDHDLRSFPGMTAMSMAEDIVRVTDGQHTLDIMNVNTTGFETATGVDLVYYNYDYDSFVLVQYKRKEPGNGSRIAGVDARLPLQLTKMVAFDAIALASASISPSAYRLGTGATFIKFASPALVPIREQDLTRGIYVPSGLLKRLHDAGLLVGPGGGAAITYANLGRWIQNDAFADLVRKGWVGTSGLTVADLKAFVAERLSEGRLTVVAAHSSGRSAPRPASP